MFYTLRLCWLVVVLTLSVAHAHSPLVAELQTAATVYHQDPTWSDRIRDRLERAIKTDSHIAN